MFKIISMKKYIVIFSATLLGFGKVKGQSGILAASFTYDLVGNRIERKIICIGCPKPADTAQGGHAFQQPAADGPIVDAYPNPAESELFINNRKWKENDKAAVTVFDVAGKLILERHETKAVFSMPLNDIVPGTYMVRYDLNNTAIQVWKIVKM